jgi:hypothetical protein
MVRDYLAEMTPEERNHPEWQLLAEVLRVDPAFRKHYLAPDSSGGMQLGLRPSTIPDAVAALRALPDDAGTSAIAAALRDFLQ